MRENGNGPIGQSTPVTNSPLHIKTLAIPHIFGVGYQSASILSTWHETYGGHFTSVKWYYLCALSFKCFSILAWYGREKTINPLR